MLHVIKKHMVYETNSSASTGNINTFVTLSTEEKEKHQDPCGLCMYIYSCPCLVVDYTEELISRTFLDENRFRLVSQDRMSS